ncbi:MAG: PQQ-binding-like beta-propeller repeat protein [Planctomycetales bacterium]|nr:PQQ-binding-like beta-propeller repeat protein [Planctomycetales bacterium]
MKRLIKRIRCLLPLLVLPLIPTRGDAEDWPQFRGHNAGGVSTSEKSLPTEFSDAQNRLWSVKVGDGACSPIVFDGRVFTTAMTGEQELAVFAFDAATGQELWKQEYDTGKLPRTTPPNSAASSTPACDGERIYVYFSTLGLLALDVRTGAKVWRHEMEVPAYLMDWGAASSPIVYKDSVLFNQDDDLAPALFAVDSRTGKRRWKAERSEMLAGYAIPVICEANGRTDVVISGSGKLKGYDPLTGKELWTCNTLLRTMITSPVERDGVIYVSVQSYGDHTRTLKFALLEWLDTDQDGILSRAEIPVEFWSRFDQSDRDKSGTLSGIELDTAFVSLDNQTAGGNTIQAIRGGGTGDVTKTHVLWNLNNRSPSNISSPLVVNEQLFVVKKGGISSSFSTKDGTPHWELSRIRAIGDYYGSPAAGDGKIYVPGENGTIVVLEQGSKLKVLAQNDIGESCLSSPAIADGRLFIRGRESLHCFSREAQ